MLSIGKGAIAILLNRLLELRMKNGLTQEDLSQLLGVARTTYAMYEQGKRQMDYELLLKLCDYYKVSLDYLFGRTDLPIHKESYTPDEIEFVTKSLEVYKEVKSKFQ